MPSRRTRSRAFRGFVLAVAVLVAASVLSACTKAPIQQAAAQPSAAGSSGTASASPSASPTSSSPTSSPSVTATPTPTPQAKPVHVSLLENDGATYGVGMPIIAWFNVAPTDATAFAKATTVTVNGKPVQGGWYFEKTDHAGSALEAHYRVSTYWPAHSAIKLDLPVKGLSAGTGLAYDDSLTLAVSIGAANVSTVDANTLTMTVMTDGKLYGRFPVSLGAANTPTARGTKVIMEKGLDIAMSGPGYYDAHVQYTQRLTYGGEYLHSAPWNVGNIGSRSTSNGCTNLLPAQAKQLYAYFEIGDVVLYPNASGPAMTLGAGYGDWNVAWSQWVTGGALKTT